MTTEMPEEYKQQLAVLVRDWGMLGVLRGLADINEHWSIYFDASAATRSYGVAATSLRALADYLEGLA